MKINYEGGPTLNLGQILLEDRDYENFGEMEIEQSFVQNIVVNVGNDDVNSDVAITRYSRGKPPSNCICWSVKAKPNVVLRPAISSYNNFIKTRIEKVANNFKLRKLIDR